MAKLIVHNPPTVKLKASGYIGTPTGDIELTENNRTYNVSSFATATTAIPEEEKTVTPSTTEQVITPDEGLLKKVTVYPTPLESKTVAPTTEQQTITPEAPAIGLSEVTVGAVTPSIDPDIQPENIRKGVDILGVEGTMEAKSVEVTPKDVNYYDYDGTLLYSYTTEEFLALLNEPNLPTNDGLICQGWNWTFQGLKNLVSEYGVGEAGAMYITDDGKTRIYVHIPNDTYLHAELHLYTGGNVTVDWGDGAQATERGEGNIEMHHDWSFPTYPVDTVITISCDGDYWLNQRFFCSEWENNPRYAMIRRIEFGQNAYVNEACIDGLLLLKTITLPRNSTKSTGGIGIWRTGQVDSLQALVLPYGTTEIGSYDGGYPSCKKYIFPETIHSLADSAVTNCGADHLFVPPCERNADYIFGDSYNLRSATVLGGIVSSRIFNNANKLSRLTLLGVTSVDFQAIASCGILSYLKIPSTVTRIGEWAFAWSGIKELDMTDFIDPSSIPTLEDTGAISEKTSIITVANQEMLDAFSAATNWSTYAEIFVIKE